MTRDPDETLDAIDDVIAWHGSRDAMVWTAAEPAKPLDLPRLPRVRVDPEAAHRLFEGLSVAMRTFSEAMRPIAESMARGLAEWARSPAMQQMIAFANSPEGRALIEAHERGEIEPEPDPCNCLCGPRHGDRMGICEGEAVGTRRYEAPSTGAVDVPMCAPCLSAERTPA